jgi:beta-alanine degradation protein BauB
MQVANAVGDPARTAHSNYIRMAGGTSSDLHVHSFDYYAVVITGVVVNERTAASPERRLMAGSLWYQKAKESHVTKCVSSTECIFFVTSPGPFDYVSVPAH